MKKIIAASVLCFAVLTSSGCFSMTQNTTPSAINTYDFSQMHLIQLDEPKEGSPTAVIETTKGTITFVLYPEYAPKTVENFVNRANEGYYNGKDIYGIVEKAIFMSGAYNEERTQGVTEDGELIKNECSVDLWPFKGALCSYSGTAGYSDSRFFVVDEYPLTDENIEELRTMKNSDGERFVPDELIDAFIEKGCFANIGGSYTVFGQAIDGIEIIEEICGTETDENANPAEKLYIDKITISEYTSEKQ